MSVHPYFWFDLHRSSAMPDLPEFIDEGDFPKLPSAVRLAVVDHWLSAKRAGWFHGEGARGHYNWLMFCFLEDLAEEDVVPGVFVDGKPLRR